ncbi:MAG: septum formation initiator family protein [Candidatus Omnitrophica bacterium]|nr:septum formation initiator family protein [Candidatus Omnitrophota bacterium]
MEPKKQILTAAAIAGGLLFIYGPGALRWVEMKIQRFQLESEISTLKSENQRLYQESRRLREDPSYAEALYRQQLGVVRPGETVIRLKPQNPESKRSVPDRQPLR